MSLLDGGQPVPGVPGGVDFGRPHERGVQIQICFVRASVGTILPLFTAPLAPGPHSQLKPISPSIHILSGHVGYLIGLVGRSHVSSFFEAPRH